MLSRFPLYGHARIALLHGEIDRVGEAGLGVDRGHFRAGDDDVGDVRVLEFENALDHLLLPVLDHAVELAVRDGVDDLGRALVVFVLLGNAEGADDYPLCRPRQPREGDERRGQGRHGQCRADHEPLGEMLPHRIRRHADEKQDGDGNQRGPAEVREIDAPPSPARRPQAVDHDQRGGKDGEQFRPHHD